MQANVQCVCCTLLSQRILCVCVCVPLCLLCCSQAVFRDGDQVVLNVGGLRFTTTVNTLRGAPSPSLFAAMFSGRHAVQTAPDGSVFIDRCAGEKAAGEGIGSFGKGYSAARR